eukprot:TRINITY_DN2146_c0_g1_i1.p1 TRINITY_DN2146_c0_g1~~TRINITY_DN2146_c0_g1_i1.p1  ORF type:complete len:306 (-),score=89.47 TRINITY_DN2146_c0_g1_i1:1409-2326(-)
MEEDTWMHYCEDPKAKQLVLCDMKDIKAIQTWRLNSPYDSSYYFDTVQVKNFIYFTGGGTPVSEASPEQFYQITMRMTIMPSMVTVADKLANMNFPRANHTMEAVGGTRLYVVGGSNSSGNLSSCEEYNIAENKWREIAPLNEKKKWISVCAYKAKHLYAFGGYLSDESNASDLIEVLDMENPLKAWEVVKIESGEELFKNTFLPGAIPVADDCILVFGGIVKTEVKDACFAFDPVKRTLTKRRGILKKDSFYRTKYGKKGDTFGIVGAHDGDLHYYDSTKGKWGLMLKKIWNPDYGFAIKADTY